jgi:hypothetical protein
LNGLIDVIAVIRTDMVIMTMGTNDGIRLSMPVDRCTAVVRDRMRLQELYQSVVGVFCISTTARINEYDGRRTDFDKYLGTFTVLIIFCDHEGRLIQPFTVKISRLRPVTKGTAAHGDDVDDILGWLVSGYHGRWKLGSVGIQLRTGSHIPSDQVMCPESPSAKSDAYIRNLSDFGLQVQECSQ